MSPHVEYIASPKPSGPPWSPCGNEDGVSDDDDGPPEPPDQPDPLESPWFPCANGDGVRKDGDGASVLGSLGSEGDDCDGLGLGASALLDEE